MQSLGAPRTIGFDATPLCRPVTGIGRYAFNLITAYASAYPNANIKLVCFADDTLNSAFTFTAPNIEVSKLPLPRKPYQLTYRKLVRPRVDLFLERLKLDVLVCANFTIFPYTKSIPTVLVVHDLAYERYPGTIEKKNLAYLRKHVGRSVREASTLVAISEFTKQEMIELFGIHAEKIHLVINGVLPRQHQLLKRDGSILTVGTLEPRKNLMALIKAYSAMPTTFQSKHPLNIVGATGWGEMAHSNNTHINFLGHIDDTQLDQLYATCGLFVMPSIYEGFGLPLLEAMSANSPVLASDIPPFHQIGGDTITYFDPTSTAAITESLNNFFTGRDAKDVTIAVERSKEFTWRNAAMQLSGAVQAAYEKSAE